MSPRLRFNIFRPTIILWLAFATPAIAVDGLLEAEEFETLSEGRTLHFSQGGQPFGSEQYFSDRRSIWRTPDGACEFGRWTPRGETICFVYELTPETQCWRFSSFDGRIRANFVLDDVTDPEAVDLDRIDNAPLECPGPGEGS